MVTSLPAAAARRVVSALFISFACLTAIRTEAAAPPAEIPAAQPSSDISAARLDRMCREYRAYFMGAAKPDLLMAKQCESYIKGFLDSLIFARAFAKKQFFCPQGPVTPQAAADTLALWISAHGAQAQSVTAAVGLLGALAAAHPCPDENAPARPKTAK